MRLILTSLAFALTTACSAASTAKPIPPVTKPAEGTKVVAALSYASWCGSCRALDPKIEAIQTSGGIDGLEIVVLDYTAKDKDTFFANAETAGVASTLKSRFSGGVSTGILFLIDAKSGEIISEVRKSMTEAEIRDAMKSAVISAT